jgi:hypothetical protein
MSCNQSNMMLWISSYAVVGRSSGSCHGNHHRSCRHHLYSLPHAAATTTSDGALGDDCVDQIDVKKGGAQHMMRSSEAVAVG